MILISRPKRPTSSASTLSRRPTPRSFPGMKRAPSKPWIGSIPCSRFRPGARSATVLEYFRHGTLSLYAALNTATGEVLGQTSARHTSAEFIAFLAQLLATEPARREVHLIVDNLSAHKTKAVAAFLSQHPRLHLHDTPTYSSWLNQVEIWLSKIQRDLIARGVCTSRTDLARKIMRYIRLYNKSAKPIKWAYRDPSHRIH